MLKVWWSGGRIRQTWCTALWYCIRGGVGTVVDMFPCCVVCWFVFLAVFTFGFPSPCLPAQLLLDHGAGINDVDSCRSSALFSAVAGGHPDVVEELLARGADVTLCDRLQRSCVHHAAMAGDGGEYFGGTADDAVAALQCLLNHPNGRPLVHARDVGGITPLHLAALEGHTTHVQVLLDHDALRDAQDSHGRTPLQLAGRFPDVQSLLAVDKV
eukprot:m.257462 g.257462  ORF g.257462 m.257462 type:complete len:213 (+) comp19181_c0_seq18:1168-1806(+)